MDVLKDPNYTPAPVPRAIGTMQAGEARPAETIRSRWAWAEPSVWTSRMLTALENGVKGNVWFSLIDKVYSPANLLAAWNKVSSNKGAAGVDHVTIEMFEERAEANLKQLSEQLRTGAYRPQAIRRTHIPKPDGTLRPLGIPTVRDRVAQTALRHVLEPIFEKGFAAHSYGFRPGRGCKDALRRVDQQLKDGCRFAVDADLKSYFDTIPHDRLMERVRERVADGRVLKLIESFLTQGVMEGLEQWTPMAGSPQGAVISPLLANIYLDPLDRLMAEEGFEMTRYADDFVILCQTREEAERALDQVERWVRENGLTLHPDKTRVVNVTEESFEFLGYRFDKGRRWPRKKSLGKLRETIRHKTRRTNGTSLAQIIATMNPVLRGWFGYFKHSYKTTFGSIDGWVRMRLRSILRKRRGGRGVGRGMDHHRWPNASFAKLKLYSLQTAWVLNRQSASAANCRLESRMR
jgi:RNA-directed DNA polymerase